MTVLQGTTSKRINQGFIAVDDPTRYTDDPVFLFIAFYAVVVSSTKSNSSSPCCNKGFQIQSEDIHVNFFGGMEIISAPKGH